MTMYTLKPAVPLSRSDTSHASRTEGLPVPRAAGSDIKARLREGRPAAPQLHPTEDASDSVGTEGSP